MEDIILNLLNELHPENDYASSTDFVEDGLLNSLDIVELMSAFEEEFDVDIPGTELLPENFISVSSIVELVKRYRQ